MLDNDQRVIGYREASYRAEGGKDVKKPSLSNIIGMARITSLAENR